MPDVDVAAYRLAVVADGRARPVPYERLASGRDQMRAVLDCTGGWYAEQEWRGVRLDRLLTTVLGAADREAGRSVDVVSVTGYRRRLPRYGLWLPGGAASGG